jgi:hypothetical protein
MIVYSKGIAVTSTDAGAEAFKITSTEEEKKTVKYIEYTDIGTNAVLLSVWLEREKIVDAIPLEVVADLMPVRRIPIEVEVPIGEELVAKVTPQVAATHGTIDGAVYYTIAK